MSTTEKTIAELFAAVAARPADAPVVMVNLLQFKKPGGQERYLQYGQESAPHLDRVGARIVYGGVAPAVLLGEGQKPWWDAILIVEYPTPAAFIEMVTAPDYPQELRADALDRGDLIATSTWSAAEQIS
jgi:uncharacterized protein (DUF1330 family)